LKEVLNLDSLFPAS